ncbi:hypothetical protein [Polaribacter sp. Z022]|uniref:hypothetical protein n=1 Tax=Polaribacter sp. Z022 TaxID=2927125 RepID=UPI0020203BE0|nr:hypothetical protein [Polaribacter sp. Z022]MCL7752147.1 hypothetical protein [Polaribacter sp. Z022]
MKKVSLILVLSLTSLIGFSQEKIINVGVFGAIPLGETEDVSKVGIGLETTYLFIKSGKFNIGASTGVSYFGGKKVSYTEDNTLKHFTYRNAKYIPIMGAFRYNTTNDIYLGLDLGYTVGIGKGIKNGFQYKPRVGWKLSKLLAINASFTGLKVKSNTWKTFGIGLEFSL